MITPTMKKIGNKPFLHLVLLLQGIQVIQGDPKKITFTITVINYRCRNRILNSISYKTRNRSYDVHFAKELFSKIFSENL